MKRIAFGSFAGLMVVALAVIAAYAGPAAETPEQELPDGQARVVVPVEGMTCGGCCNKVETAVKELDGVVATKADHQKGRATVTYEKDKVTVKQIVDTINDKTSFKASMPKKTEKAAG
jgi:copper chaperone CopZ